MKLLQYGPPPPFAQDPQKDPSLHSLELTASFPCLEPAPVTSSNRRLHGGFLSVALCGGSLRRLLSTHVVSSTFGCRACLRQRRLFPLSLLNCFAFNILTSFASCLVINIALSLTLGADEVDGDVDSDSVARTVDVSTASCAPPR